MKKLALLIGSLLLIGPMLMAQDYYRVRKHGRISTGLNEAAAVPFEDGIVYITESTSVGASSPTDNEGRRLFTIFLYKEGMGQKRPLCDNLVSQRHEGPASFTEDYKTMVFSQQRPAISGRGTDPLGIYFAELDNGSCMNIREFEHNNDLSWFFSPSISPDGNTLFFSSNDPEGEGGFDLYVSYLKGGAWSVPENLGPGVNTPDNEIYPFIHSSGRLCFSSDGHDNNTGGFDLFETFLVEGQWARAVKFPPPFSSLSDDYHVWFSEDLKNGFLTSNRGSGSKEIFTFSAAIPVFEDPKPIKKTYYKYKIYDRKLDTVDTNLFRYSWTINDTLTLAGHEIIYKFPKPGRYVCKLNVYDIELDTLVEGQTVNTLNIRLNEQAVINCPDTVRVNTPVNFDGTDTYLPEFNVGRMVWDFGDGKYGQGDEVEHTYLYPGSYRVILGVEERRRNRREEPEVKSNFKDIVVTMN